VEQNLLVFSHLYRIGRHDRHEAIERSLELANLVDRRATRVDKLSGGMRRRLLIARALVHQPRLLLMDEPTVGLDPQVRQQLWALIDQLRSEGTTILMSTHYIEEAQRLRRVRGRAQAGEPRGRVRAVDRRGDRLMATAAPTPKIGRLERSAITGVLVREVVNFSSYWRAATFSSTVEPTIYLLAFGF